MMEDMRNKYGVTPLVKVVKGYFYVLGGAEKHYLWDDRNNKSFTKLFYVLGYG